MSVVNLIPVHQVTSLPSGGWRSLGEDPHFHVEGLPNDVCGWVAVSLDGASSEPRPIKLYLDHGEGFSERDSFPLATLRRHRNRTTQYIYLSKRPIAWRLDAGEAPGEFFIDDLRIRPISAMRVNLNILDVGLKEAWHHRRKFLSLPRRIVKHGIRANFSLFRERVLRRRVLAPPPTKSIPYSPESHQSIVGRASAMHQEIAGWQNPPTISLLVPVYNPRPRHLLECIESIKAQIYPHWQLCLADDASTHAVIRTLLEQAAASDPRITVVYRPVNGHICHATNSALELAKGTYAGLLDNDDLLTPDALFEMAKVIVSTPDVDYLYSDEDKIDDKTGVRADPFYKPDWLPDLLVGFMYTCHLSVYRTSLIHNVGGFRVGFEGSQDHDLCLRVAERNPKVMHIPKVLYHWRVHQNSTAAAASTKNYADSAGLRAVQESLVRRGEGGIAQSVPGYPGRYYTRYPITGAPLVSIIIPTRDGADILETCLKSVFAKTTYRNFEIIIIDNGSVQPEIFTLFDRYRASHGGQFRVERHDIPFNFSRLNNLGAQVAKGVFILMLNNDTEVIAPTWLEEMLGWAQRPSIGVVGAMLLFPDDTIQHAGVILGIGGVAGHSHKYVHSCREGYFGRLLVPSPYTAVTAACLLVRKAVFEQVGGLSEELHVAFNDIDFCCKVHSLGLQAVVPPKVMLYHHESKSRGSEDNPIKQARFNQETACIRSRWESLLGSDPAYSPNLSFSHEDFRLKNEL